MSPYDFYDQATAIEPLAPAFPPRDLGYGEQLWLRISEARSNNFVMVVQLVGRVDVTRLKAAMVQVMLAFPIMRARVDGSAQQPGFCFARSARVPLKVVPRRTDDEWHRLAEQELEDAITPDSELLWRATLLLGEGAADLLFTVNHAIGDGQSSYTFIRELFECYASGTPLAPMAPTPAYDSLLRDAGRWRLFAKGLPMFARQLRRSRQPAASTPAQKDVMNGHIGKGSARTGFLDMALDEAASAAIVRQSKRYGVSMHALLSSLFLLSAYEAMGAGEPRHIVMSAAINVRPKLQGEHGRDVGYFASGMESGYSISRNSRIWPLAQKVDQDVQQQFTADSIRFGLLLRRLILALKKDPEALVQTIAKNAKAAIHLTNLGRATLGTQYGDLAIRRCFPIPSVHFLDKPMVCLAAVSFNKVLQLTFAYSAPLTDPIFVETLAGRFLERLRLVSDETAYQGSGLTL